MMQRRFRVAALLIAAPTFAILASVHASAGVDAKPRVESTCTQSKIVLRPRDGWSLDDVAPGVRVPLVQVEICAQAHRACLVNGDEVPMSECQTSG